MNMLFMNKTPWIKAQSPFNHILILWLKSTIVMYKVRITKNWVNIQILMTPTTDDLKEKELHRDAERQEIVAKLLRNET